MWADFPLFGDLNKRQNLAFDAQDLVNLFLVEDYEGKKKFAFLATPGLRKEVEISSGTEPTRALYPFGNNLYGVFGSAVYRFNTDLVPTLLGNLTTVSGAVSITANNGNQIIFTDGKNGYIYNINTGNFGVITDADFPPLPLNVAFLDGLFVIPSGESRQFQISAFNDGTNWAALDEAQIQAYPGENMGVGVVNRRLYFFKTDSTEVWYNQGAADFPFRRDNNLLFNFGCKATASIASGYGFLLWLAQDASGVGSVMMTTGQVPEKVSDDAIENIINSLTNPADVVAYICKYAGHIFYVMSWNTDDLTLAYDISMKTWIKLEMLKSKAVFMEENSGKTRHLGNCHAYFNGVHYLGSYKAPILYSYSLDYADNDGEPMKHVRTPRHFFDPQGYKSIQIDAFQVDMQMGIGSVTGNDSDPKVCLSVSRDGGQSFGNEVCISIGKIGERKKRAIFRKKGIARNFVPRITIYNSVNPIAILGASINYEVLNR